jgi:hypothetical protein
MQQLTRHWVHTLAVAALALAAAVVTVVAHAAEEAPPATGLVLVDQAALRAAPREAAPLLVPLWRGEALQLRGQRGDWLQVWDAHRERGGFVRAAQVLALPPGEAAVADLSAQLRLLRGQPGAESLGIGVAAALSERSSAAWLASPAGAEMLDTLVVLQDRLAQRVQAAQAAQQTSAAAHADVARRYGFALRAVPRADGAQQPCADLHAATLLRGHRNATAAQQARAALALTRGDCVSTDLLPSQRLPLLEQHAAWLDGIALADLPPVERNRLLLRRASVLASLAFARREGDARGAATAAFAAWTQLIPSELTDDDSAALREAAIRLSPQRWLLQPAAAQRQLGRFELRLERGGPGETCLVWSAPAVAEPARRCSHGVVHLASARMAPDSRSVVLSVQPLDGWTELWRLDDAGRVQVLPPAAEAPGLGAVEWAGWFVAQGSTQVLVAREAEAGGRTLRRFEVYGADWLQTLRWAADPQSLGPFQRGADAGWRSMSTIAR